MERLKGLDGGFASFESPTAHLHILGTLVFDPGEMRDEIDFWRIRQLVSERVALVTPFRQRLIEVPFGLQHPAMVDDPGFDIDYHVRRVSLPAPGGIDELSALVADLASRPLDRSRPLWEFHVVEGLEGGRLAVVPKVHHTILDGVSGAEVMAAFFDFSPMAAPHPLFGGRRRSLDADRAGSSGGSLGAGAARGPTLARVSGNGDQENSGERPPRDPSWSPEPLPSAGDQLRSVLGSLPGQADAVMRSVGRTVRGARAVAGRRRNGAAESLPLPFEAPRTSINRAISAHRRVAFAEVPMDDLHRVREVLGGTTNDVLLAMVAGSLRRFFASRQEKPGRPLVALVPVSVRLESEREALGNRVSAMLVPLDEDEDPAVRIERIMASTASAKEQNRIVGSEIFAGWAQSLFPAMATRLSRLATNLRLFDHVPPPFNMVVSNVPGADIPLYMAGARMVAMYPLGPIFEGIGINVTAFSYLDTLFVGIQGCRELVPDIDLIASGLGEARYELLRAVNRRTRPVPWWHGELPA